MPNHGSVILQSRVAFHRDRLVCLVKQHFEPNSSSANDLNVFEGRKREPRAYKPAGKLAFGLGASFQAVLQAM